LPHGHLRSLFGGEAAFEISQRASSVMLIGLTILMSACAAKRATRAS